MSIKDIKLAIKADEGTPYKVIKKVMSELQDMQENRYYLITSLKNTGGLTMDVDLSEGQRWQAEKDEHPCRLYTDGGHDDAFDHFLYGLYVIGKTSINGVKYA